MKTTCFPAGLFPVVSAPASNISGSVGIHVFGILYFITGLLLFNTNKYPVYPRVFLPLIGMTRSPNKFEIPESITIRNYYCTILFGTVNN